MQLNRDRRAHDLVPVDNPRLADAGPLFENLADGHIVRNQRHTSVPDSQLELTSRGGCRSRREDESDKGRRA
jgi:hypothetical protein